jgi:uncharacterized membrane protein YsdA (DUF1294 family)
MKYFLIYLLIINFIGFFAMFLDKQKAKGGKWRIPEKTLFLLALIGGSLGTTIGMHAFHHKTKHWYFKFGMPLIFIIQLVLFFNFAS